MNSSITSTPGTKDYIFYGTSSQVLFGLAGSLALLNTIPVETLFLIILLVFLVLGIVHLFALNKFLPNAKIEIKITITALISVLGLVIVFLFYHFFLTNVKDKLLAFGLVAFPLPFFIMLAFQLFLNIPEKEYKKWYYPLNQEMPNLDLLDLTQVLVIQFEFYKNTSDKEHTNFKAKAPYEMSLGQLFFIFINDYNERNPNSPIIVTDSQSFPYGWHFYKKSSWWKSSRYFDSDLTFRNNLILNNDIIICKRCLKLVDN